MIERNANILKNIPPKQTTNKSIQKVEECIDTSFLKKCVTSTVDTNKKNSNFKRINTCQNMKVEDIALLKIMSEHVYTYNSIKKSDNDSEDSEDEGEDFQTKNRNYKVKTRTITKIGTKIRNKTDKSLNKELPIKEEALEKEVDIQNLADHIDSLSTSKGKALNKEDGGEQTVLDNLLSKYYYDIAENIDGNFENYAVNNLTIISYLDRIIPKKQPVPQLSSENLKILNSFDRSKKILILDLDETLIHSDFNSEFEYYDAVISVNIDNNNTCPLKILIRPYTTEFLEFAKENFNVVLFTAGIQDYADAIVNYLDPLDEFFKLRLYRDSCLEYRNFFIKDLSIFTTFGLKDMIIVDNCLYSFARNLKNGILIPSYYSDPEDRQLLEIKDYITGKLMDTKDIREVNESYYGLESIKNFLYEKLEKEGLIG